MTLEKKTKFNRLRFLWREKSKELELIREQNSIAQIEFNESLMALIIKEKMDDPFEKKQESPKEKSNAFELEETKKVYRDIALKSHPDKNPSGESVFKETVDAKENDSLNALFNNARKLKVKINEITYEQIDKLDAELKEIQGEIDEIINSIHWIWYHENNNNKTRILTNLIKQIKYEQKKK